MAMSEDVEAAASMEQRGNDHVDWWAVSVRQRREIKRLLTALLAAKTEINWWVKEHGCCAGHEDTVVAQIDAVLSSNDEAKLETEMRRCRPDTFNAVPTNAVVIGTCVLLKDGEIVYAGPLKGTREVDGKTVLLNPVDYKRLGAIVDEACGAGA